MGAQSISPNDLLQQFENWGNQKRMELLNQPSAEERPLEEEVSQGEIFIEDLKRNAYALPTESTFLALSISQQITTIALSPFAVIAECFSLCCGSINASTCLKNIRTIPIHIVVSILKFVGYTIQTMNKTVRAASTGIGFLVWHSGECMVQLIKGSSSTVLSNHRQIRDIVYHSIGLTLLAAGMIFVPIAPVQMIALPILFGSIYGTINNQFTLRECPEYYTMGHYFDGTDLKGHAIKTNNLAIKPIITGCYATVFVTKLAGIILAATGTLPYTSAVLPVSYAAGMIAGVIVISLIAAHVFSNMVKNTVQKELDDYAELIGIEWTDAHLNMNWNDLEEIRQQAIEKKRHELSSDPERLDLFNSNLEKLTQSIESFAINPDRPGPHLPIKYIVGWQANNARNGVGYLCAGGGSLIVSITTIFLRIFVL